MIDIEKEWAAVHGDKIIEKRETKSALKEAIDMNMVSDEVEIVALPKNTIGSFL